MMAYKVGEYIKRRRKQFGISRADLSEEVCSERTLARLEGGRSKPENNVYEQIMIRLGMFPGRVDVHSWAFKSYYKERHQVEWLLLHNKTKEATCYTEYLRSREAFAETEAGRQSELVSGILSFREGKTSPEEYIETMKSILLEAVDVISSESVSNAVFTLLEMVACVELARGMDALGNYEEGIAILRAFIFNMKRGLTAGYEHKLLLLTAITLCARLNYQSGEYAAAIGCCREAYMCACGEDIYSAQLLYIEAKGFELAKRDGVDRRSEWPYEQMTDEAISELKWTAYYMADMLGDNSLRDEIGSQLDMTLKK